MLSGWRRPASSITPLRWLGIAACLAVIAGALVWSAGAWARAIENWRVTSAIVAALAVLTLARVAKGQAGYRRARERVELALRDAPAPLLAEELVSICRDAPLVTVDRVLKEGVVEGWIRIVGAGEGSMRYGWGGAEPGVDS